jgi:hypothetical protein
MAAKPTASPAKPLAKPVAHAARRGLMAWMRLHKVASVAISLLLVAGIAAAVVTIRQDVTATTSSKSPLVIFQNGADYAGINTAGFATLSFGTSATSATLALSGIPGAAQTSLGNVLKLNNQDATHPESVTLARSTTLNAAITSFTVTVKNGATTLLTWDAVSAATSSSFTLPVSTVLDISIVLVVADGTAAGSLGSFGMQFSLAPT